MSDTQKTTKGVREAPAASERQATFDQVRPDAIPSPADIMRCPPRPRYTVELTTEGWQIKDKEDGSAWRLLADTFGTKQAAQDQADAYNEMDRS